VTLSYALFAHRPTRRPIGSSPAREGLLLLVAMVAALIGDRSPITAQAPKPGRWCETRRRSAPDMRPAPDAPASSAGSVVPTALPTRRRPSRADEVTMAHDIDDPSTNTFSLHPLTDDQALAWLRRQPDGRVQVTISGLARTWAWDRRTVQRRLVKWAADGHLSRELLPDGTSVIVACAPAHPVQSPAHPPAHRVADRDDAAAQFSVSAAPAHVPARRLRTPLRSQVRTLPTLGREDVHTPTPSARSSGRSVRPLRLVGALVLAGVAIAIAWTGVQVNSWYGATLGRTPEAARLFAWLSIAADVLALALPSAACALSGDRRRILACLAWSLWAITVVMALMASIGFVSLNVADTTAERYRVADQAAGLALRVERLRSERAAIVEPRAVAAIEAEVQRAQPRVPPDTWRDTKRCTDVTLPESGQACAPILRLREALGQARRRDALDLELAEAERRLATLPAVMVADPQTATASRLIAWASAGMLKVTADDVAMARIAGITLLPQLAGLVMMLAIAVGTRSN